MEEYKHIFSLGYRCSSAGILKSLGLKRESYPFDWLVSRLPIIEHCIQTDFREFLDSNNYRFKSGVTNNYTSLDPSSQQYICDESICYNEYYENTTNPSLPEFYLPCPISRERDAYGYKLMMNHHNIQTNQHQEYFARCVERWNRNILQTHKTRKLALYIHPAIFYASFLSIKRQLLDDIRRFFRSNLAEYVCDGIFIIPVKTPFDNPTNHCAKYVLEEQADDISLPGCRICILWANREFIDAGEIFMGNCHAETYVVKDYLHQTVNNKGLLNNSATI
jgi:hypothetical protein